MNNQELLFKQFKPMLQKAAWNIKRKYRFIDYADIQSEAYAIFCETLQKFNPEKASSSTYLYSRLQKLNRKYGYVNKEKIYYESNSENDLNGICSLPVFEKVMERIDSKLRLSEDARHILNFITSRCWEVPGIVQLRPTYYATKRWYHYGEKWEYARFDRAWKEIKVS